MATFTRGDRVQLRSGIDGPESERGEERIGTVLAELAVGGYLIDFAGAGSEIFSDDELELLGHSVLPPVFVDDGGPFSEDSTF